MCAAEEVTGSGSMPEAHSGDPLDVSLIEERFESPAACLMRLYSKFTNPTKHRLCMHMQYSSVRRRQNILCAAAGSAATNRSLC